MAAEDAGKAQVVGKQEECSEELLHSHHGLREMLQVHVGHLGRLCASDAIMMLHLKAQATHKSFIKMYFSLFFCTYLKKITLALLSV